MVSVLFVDTSSKDKTGEGEGKEGGAGAKAEAKELLDAVFGVLRLISKLHSDLDGEGYSSLLGRDYKYVVLLCNVFLLWLMLINQ